LESVIAHQAWRPHFSGQKEQFSFCLDVAFCKNSFNSGIKGRKELSHGNMGYSDLIEYSIPQLYVFFLVAQRTENQDAGVNEINKAAYRA
jgi:hypothetical protein